MNLDCRAEEEFAGRERKGEEGVMLYLCVCIVYVCVSLCMCCVYTCEQCQTPATGVVQRSTRI